MNICLYGASSTELDARYLDAAYDLGRRIAVGGHTMVYGGGAQGVMGAAARGVVDGGGALVGIAPTFFKKAPGVLFDECSEFIDTKTMAERKTLMMQRADAFVMALAVLNTLGYYDAMQIMLEHTVAAHFAKPICLQIYRLFDEPAALMDYLEHYDPDEVDVRHIKNI